MSIPPDIAANRAAILRTIADNAKAADRDPQSVTLVAVSKRQPEARVEAALAAGQRVFGENRVQEAQDRWAFRRARINDLELRLVGGLQSNKAADAAALFDVIETVDRPKLAHALADAVQALGRAPRFYVQVNTGEEPQKSGVPPLEAEVFVRTVRDDYGLPVEGLMCIPPINETPATHFALLADLAERCGLDRLSMGMSGDYDRAVRFGATSVRVGSALFGPRPA
ncbi:MAG: YggS family pyridoxal phosphate-dependent enzyme [Maricaulaceae bacterium]